MADFTKFLSTAPVTFVLFSSLIFGLFIEINRFFPDILTF
ncbi:MAG: Photosystem I reaction center subunit IX [Synechococcaceae cyanobacterium SM2_3_2]|nr:Photosystem I reaction center subunit IX [Synechococcaceae cyanobacterium SM2_3_2]